MKGVLFDLLYVAEQVPGTTNRAAGCCPHMKRSTLQESLPAFSKDLLVMLIVDRTTALFLLVRMTHIVRLSIRVCTVSREKPDA